MWIEQGTCTLTTVVCPTLWHAKMVKTLLRLDYCIPSIVSFIMDTVLIIRRLFQMMIKLAFLYLFLRCLYILYKWTVSILHSINNNLMLPQICATKTLQLTKHKIVPCPGFEPGTFGLLSSSTPVLLPTELTDPWIKYVPVSC